MSVHSCALWVFHVYSNVLFPMVGTIHNLVGSRAPSCLSLTVSLFGCLFALARATLLFFYAISVYCWPIYVSVSLTLPLPSSGASWTCLLGVTFLSFFFLLLFFVRRWRYTVPRPVGPGEGALGWWPVCCRLAYRLLFFWAPVHLAVVSSRVIFSLISVASSESQPMVGPLVEQVACLCFCGGGR